MQKHCSILFLIVFFGFFCNAQTVTGCDFFPNKDVVTYNYSETGLMGSTIVEIKYVFQGKVTINGDSYKAYRKLVNGAVPEVNQVTYIKCGANSLVMGNEIYTYHQEVVGQMQDITKVIDIYATPIYNVSMEPTGNYYLPTVIKPNNPIGEVWSEKSAMHGQIVEIKSTLVERDIAIDIQGKHFEHVYKVTQEFWTDVAFSGRQKISEMELYYGKGVGMVKSVKKINILGQSYETITELYNGEEREKIVGEINSLLSDFPNDPDLAETKTVIQTIMANQKNLSMEQLIQANELLLAMVTEYKQEEQRTNDAETSKTEALNYFEKRIKDKGVIDRKLTGTWEKLPHRSPSNTNYGKYKSYYKFYDDGTVEFYLDSPEPRNINIPRHLYRINGAYLESMYTTYDGAPHYTKYEMEWSSHPETGEPVFELIKIEETKRNGHPQEVETIENPNKNRGVLRYKKIE